MKSILVAVAVLAFLTGLVSAYYWYRSSILPVSPTWLSIAGVTQPGEKASAQDGWIAGLLTASGEMARLNKAAAFWAAIATLLNGLVAVLSLV